jgi:hypothetical protein
MHFFGETRFVWPLSFLGTMLIGVGRVFGGNL